MDDPLELLRRTVLDGSEAVEVHRWEAIEDAMQQLTSGPPTPEVERALVGFLRFEGELRLDPRSEIPHCMSPEEMLKSQVIQALGHWTGLTHLAEIQRVQATANSPVLRGIARVVIERAQQAKKQANGLEDVAEVRSEILTGP